MAERTSLFAYDSITVSSAWELTSVSMCCSQGEGVNASLSRIMYCTHVSYKYIVSFRSLPVFFFSSLISLIADGPHHYHLACGH